jgi:hypothetical protein
MSADRYLRLILTLIALELFWLGVRDAAPVVAQQKPDPMPVVITGIRIGGDVYTTLPVAVVGSARTALIPSSRELPNVLPLSVQAEISQPLNVRVANEPLTIQTGVKPLVVDVLPGKPSLRPGL